jgi:STE24 endopeptidase
MAGDQVGIFLISFIVGAPLLTITLALLIGDLPFKWLLTSFFVSSVAVLVSDIYPLILAPIFNTYTPLENGELKDEIMLLAKKLNFPVKGVYTVDGSKRSDHSNAFLIGFWSSSVVLYDNLIKQLSTHEILAILGHEIGHHKLNHTWKHLIVQLVFMGNFIFLFSKVVNSTAFYQSFGFEQPDVSVGLVLFSYLYSTFANFLRFVTNLVQRRFEYAADAFALSQGLRLRQALIKMNGIDHAASHVLPDPWYSLYHFAHPPLSERLAWMDHYSQNYKKQN